MVHRLISPEGRNQIAIVLQGGLGNQLFQYAAALAVARRQNGALVISRGLLQQNGDWTPREFGLDRFTISGRVMTSEEERSLPPRRWWQWNRDVRDCFEHYKHLRMGFHPIPLLSNPTCLTGYFQSAKYFQSIQEEIRKEFQISCPKTPRYHSDAELIANSDSLVVHVRRGDYLKNRLYHVCDAEYFQRAAAQLIKDRPRSEVFVFSDDLQWARDSLRFPVPTSFIQHEGPDSAALELSLMALGKSFVISNSTFGWWGAWLSTAPAKRVVAPARWFARMKDKAPDLIPDEWMRL